MSRCIACNKPLMLGTSITIDPYTGEEETMCSGCRVKSRSQFTVMSDFEYTKPAAENHINESGCGYYYEWYDK